jgi:hypothetical protein
MDAAELMEQRNYVPEATLFSDFPLFEDPKMFISVILHSCCLEKNVYFFRFYSYDGRNALKTSYATNMFFFHPITLASTCSCSVTLQPFIDPGAGSNTLLPNLEHLITAQCKSPKASHCLNFYCILILILTCVRV